MTHLPEQRRARLLDLVRSCANLGKPYGCNCRN